MSRLRVHNFTMSLDGYAAGPRQSVDAPLGVGAERLHEWIFQTRFGRAMIGQEGGEAGVNDDLLRTRTVGIGATIMGRNMFGPVRGPWPDESWRGWWGEDPPFGHDVFVLTHHPRADLAMRNGTTFHFVDANPHEVLAMATRAAGGQDVVLGGGAATIRQFLRAGLVDEMHLAIAPVLLGAGERLFDNLPVGLSGYTVSELTCSAGIAHVHIRRATSGEESRMPEPQILLSGLAIGESPRWHAGRLWFSDFGTREVGAVDLAGTKEIIARVPSVTSGLGWLPDGRLLIVAMRDGLLLRRELDGSLATHADLAAVARPPWNDMVVDGRGNAYVGSIGFDFPGGAFAPGVLALVRPDGTARQVADGMAFANGLVVTPDYHTLIVAESYAHRLTAFDVVDDGGLTNRRVWADLGDAAPDGICLDAEGAVWYADVPHKRCVRVREGGEVLQTIELDRGCFACALGGPDRGTLFMMAADFSNPAAMAGEVRSGQVLGVAAPAPGAGWP